MSPFWKKAKERFIFGYPIFTGLMSLIGGSFVGIALFFEWINGDRTAVTFTINQTFNSVTIIGLWIPMLIFFPLIFTMIFIGLGTTWENWEDDYR